jgi:transcriptional regulator with XRE-family HTH domain
MKSKEELMRSRGYWMAQIQLDLFFCVEEYMKKNGLNRSQLAEKLGVTKGYISQVLNGEFNHRIATFVDLALAIGKVPKVEFEDLEELVANEREGYSVNKWKVIARRNPSSAMEDTPYQTNLTSNVIVKNEWCQTANCM